MRKIIARIKLNRINKEILNLSIDQDGRYQQLVNEREEIERRGRG